MSNTTLERQRKDRAIQYLRNELANMSFLESIRDDLFSAMVIDWINNTEPDEPGFETADQMKELIDEEFSPFQLDVQDADKLLNIWKAFVTKYYRGNTGGRRRKTRISKKSKKRSKKTRKH